MKKWNDRTKWWKKKKRVAFVYEANGLGEKLYGYCVGG